MISAVVLLGALASGPWELQEVPTKERLRGLSVVSDRIAWASGTKGTVIRTTDGGKRWDVWRVPGADDLDFRDIEAFDDRTAYLLSIGPGEKSRIYRTNDGGATWELQYTNRDPKGFLDALAFWDAKHGLAMGDPVDGRYSLLTTDDGGTTWRPGHANGMPPALPGEGAFAASGTCLVVQGDRNAFFGTGGGKTARVFRSTDRGRTWTAHETPMVAGAPASGIFSIGFRDAEHGVIVGGTFDKPDDAARVAATTSDGGKTWGLVERSGPGGYRSAVAFVEGKRWVAVGPSGTDVSEDDGRTWKPLGTLGFHAAAFRGPRAGWAVSEGGRVARFVP